MFPIHDSRRYAALLAVLVGLAGSLDAGDAAASAVLWDTVTHAGASLAPEAVARKEGWRAAVGKEAGIVGDACLVSRYGVLVFRKGGRGAEWYYKLGENLVRGPTLVPVGAEGDKAKAIDSLSVVESSDAVARLDVGSVTESGKRIVARFLLKKDRPFVETQPGEGAEKLLVEMQSKHAVLPDPFAGDLVVDAEDTPAAQIRFPSENQVVQLLDGGDAIVMCVWRSADQAVGMTLTGAGKNRTISGTEVAYRKDRDANVWVAVLAAPAIWQQRSIKELDPVSGTTLAREVPYLAQWRADYRRADGVIDSWKVIIKKDKGEWEGFGISPKKDGTVWHPARGVFAYPARLEGTSIALRNSVYERCPDVKNKADGWAVLYPYQRIGASPKGVYGVIDILKETLDETPEFTLADDLQVKRLPRDRYPGVCATTEAVEKLFDANEETARKTEIQDRFFKMNFFCVVVRARIEDYMNWGKRMREFCAREKAGKPQLAGLVDAVDGLLARFDKDYERLKLGERTPAAGHRLTDRFIALIDSNDDKKDETAKQLGRETRVIASNQDMATGFFRMIAKDTRQRAGYLVVAAPDAAALDFATETRRRTLEVLQSSLGVEGGFTD